MDQRQQERIRKEEEEKKRREEAARQQQQQAAEKKKLETQRKQAETFNPIEELKKPLRPIKRAVEGAVQGVVEGAAGVITGETPEQFRQRQQKGKQRMQQVEQTMRANQGPGAEAVRVVAGAVPKIAEGVIDSSILLFDTATQPFRKTVGKAITGTYDPTRNPFSAEYVAANTDFGLQGPKTAIGQVSQNLLTFGLTGIAAARRLPEAALKLGTSGAGLKGAIASGVVPGAVADFLLLDPNDGNLSSMIKELIPEEHRDTFLLALAADTEDNPWVARTKAVLEGAAVGAVADSFMWMVHGRFVARLKKKQGATKAEALQSGLEAANTKKVELEQKRLNDFQQETFRWSEAQEAEMRRLSAEESDFLRTLDEAKANGVPENDPTFRNMQSELDRVQMTKIQLENEIASGYRPDSPELMLQERSASNSVGDVNTAAVQQAQLTSGPLPRAVRRPGVTAADAVGNQPVMGGSERILTDANYRMMNMDRNAERIVRDIEKNVDIQKIARDLKTTDAKVVEDSARLVEDFMNVFKDTDGPAPDIVDFLKERGATQLLINEAGVESTRILTREGTVAVKTIMAQTAEDINVLAMNADAMMMSRSADGNQFDRMLDRLEALVGLVKVTGNKLGGGLRAMGLTNADLTRAGMESDVGSSMSVKQVQDWANRIRNLKRFGDPYAVEEIQALTRAMALAGGDPTKTVSFARLIAEMGWKEAMGGMYNSIFSGPKTHLRNTVGNAYAVLARPMALQLKGTFGMDEKAFKTAVSGYQAMAESVAEAWEVGWKSFKTGDSINAKTKFTVDDLETRAMLQRAQAVARTPAEEAAVGFVHALYRFHHNPFMSFPTRALTGADDFFKTLLARQEIKMRSTMSALTDSRFSGDFDSGFDSYFKEFSKYMDPETGKILDEDILNVANVGTFQNDPGPLISTMSRWIDMLPMGRALVPVIRTPANLMRYGATHLPGINLFIKEARDVLLNPATDAATMIKKAEYEGRMAIGAMAVSGAGLWAAAGNMTGNGPPPGAERESWLLVNKPKSIKIGGKWVSYEGIEPISSIMSITADAVMLGKMGSTDAMERAIGQLQFSVAAAITDKSFFAGLSTIADMIDPKRQTATSAEKALYNTVNNFLPLSGARRALYNAMQPYIMEVDGELQRAINVASGGLILSGATRVDPLTGDEVPSFSGGFFNSTSSVTIHDVNTDPVKDMLDEINFRIPKNKTGLSGMEMTAQDRNELNRTMFQLGLRQRLEALMEEPSFKESVENYRGRPFDSENPDQMPPHYRAVWSTWTGVQNNALKMMATTNMDFRERTLKAQNIKQFKRRGDYDAVQDLINAPK